MRRVVILVGSLAVLVLLGVGARALFVRSFDPGIALDPVEFWTERRVALNDFVADFREYGRITGMSDGQRYWKQLNDAVYESRDPIRTEAPRFEHVMRRDSIDPRVYHNFRKRLVQLQLIEVESTDRYTAFIHDGMLDNLNGFVWIAPGEGPPRPGERMLDHTEVVTVTQLDGQWYYVTTT